MKSIKEMAETVVPPSVFALFALARSKKAQSSLEYIMMVAAASVIIVLALAMVVKLKGAAMGSNVIVNGTNMSVSSAIEAEIGALVSGGV